MALLFPKSLGMFPFIGIRIFPVETNIAGIFQFSIFLFWEIRIFQIKWTILPCYIMLLFPL